MLDGIMFDLLLFYQLLVIVVCVRSKASFQPRIFYDVVMRVVFNGGVFESI